MSSEYVSDTSQRLHIASRAPVNIFVPELEDQQYVSDQTGNYWPYRTALNSEISEFQRAIERTHKRCLKLRFQQDKDAGHCFPKELIANAKAVNADSIAHDFATSSRGCMAFPETIFKNHPFDDGVELQLPVVNPHRLSAKHVRSLILDRTTSTESIANTRRLTSIALRDLGHLSTTELIDIIDDVAGVLPDDIGLHLIGPQPTIYLAKYIHRHPNVVSSIDLPQTIRGDVTDSASNEYLSTTGETTLQDESSTLVQAAGEFALLTSDLIDSDEFGAAARDSILPEANEPLPEAITEAKQKTLEKASL